MVAKELAQDALRTSGSADDEALVRDQELISNKVSLSLEGGLAVDAMPEVPFEQLCHSGAAVTRSNFMVKVWRYCFAPLKQLYLPFITSNMPTNFLMLTFRTFNRDFDNPNHNDDHLACLLRDQLMPVCGRLHRERATELLVRAWWLQCPCLGIPGIVNFVDVRTQWFDGAVKRAIADGFKQVVILAAGYDTRAYRLAAEGVRFYEMDLPHASETKQRLVEQLLPRSKYSWPEFVGADLSRVSLADALKPTSFDPKQRTLFMTEGLVYYLPPGAFQQQLESISASAAMGSRLFFDFLHLSTLSGEKWHPGFETLMFAVWNKGETLYSGVDERPAAVACLMRKFGFALQQLLDGKEMQERYLPHLTWNSVKPPVSPYFGYIGAEKVAEPLPTKKQQ